MSIREFLNQNGGRMKQDDLIAALESAGYQPQNGSILEDIKAQQRAGNLGGDRDYNPETETFTAYTLTPEYLQGT